MPAMPGKWKEGVAPLSGRGLSPPAPPALGPQGLALD